MIRWCGVLKAKTKSVLIRLANNRPVREGLHTYFKTPFAETPELRYLLVIICYIIS